MPKPIEDNQQLSGRCHYCGYFLNGLEKQGSCPECGTEYTEESASRLKPWPEAYDIFMRLGWPLIVVIAPVIMMFPFHFYLVITMFEVATINVYFQVGSMFKRHLPEQNRKHGFIAGLRVIGTVFAVVVTLQFLRILWWKWYF